MGRIGAAVILGVLATGGARADDIAIEKDIFNARILGALPGLKFDACPEETPRGSLCNFDFGKASAFIAAYCHADKRRLWGFQVIFDLAERPEAERVFAATMSLAGLRLPETPALADMVAGATVGQSAEHRFERFVLQVGRTYLKEQSAYTIAVTLTDRRICPWLAK